MTRTNIISIILTTLLLSPFVAYADPLCSDGSVAPSGNICNCGNSALIGGGSFTPGVGAGLSGSSFSGINFSGVGGALMSCVNAGGAISSQAQKLFGTKQSSKSDTSKKTPASKDKGSATKGTASTGTNVPVTDSSVSSNTSSTASNTDDAKKELEKTTQREQCLNGAADAVAKIALQKLSDKTLNWIKTGFSGNPFYVRNIDSYLKSVENEKLDNYLNKYIANNNPIFGNALRSVMKQQTTGYSDGLINKAMNTPQGKAYQAFQSDFTNGGWNALLNPSNNPVGAYFDASNELNNIIGTAQKNIQDELQQGNGFLSQKKCVEYAPTPPVRKTVGTDTCGIKDSQGNCLGTPSGTQQSALASTKKPECVKYETVTPGSVISAQISAITNSTVRQLENTNKINQVLGSFFDQLMNRLFSDGITGSGRGSNTSITGGGLGTNIITGSNGQTLASPTACQTPLGYDPTTGGFNQEFDISRPQQLRAVILTQKNYITRSQDAQFRMQTLVPVLGALDYCIPGPNPSWRSSLNENAQTFISSLEPVLGVLEAPKVLGILNKLLDPINSLGLKENLNPREYIAGFTSQRTTLFDKVDYGSVRITDRGYVTRDVSVDGLQIYMSDIFDMMKSRYNGIYSDDNIMKQFLTTATTPVDIINTTAFVKESIKETGNLLGYSQGVAQYNEDYSINIEDAQSALAELQDIDQRVEQIVATAKARYIAEQAAAGTPVKVSCLDNAYQIGTVGSGLTHNENITAPPDPMIQKSKDSWDYFYNNL